jgi:hypothetical protein
MALEPMAGSSGRVQVGIVTPVLTTDVVTFTATPAAMASLSAWSVDEQPMGEQPEVVTFESTANAQGALAPQQLRGGVIKYTGQCEGVFDPTDSILFVGQPFALIDLVVKKATAGSQKGYKNVPIRISNFKVGDNVTAKTATCSFSFQVSGHLPAYATNI